MASALGSTVAAASIGSRRGFSLGRGQNLQRVMGGEVALVPLPGGQPLSRRIARGRLAMSMAMQTALKRTARSKCIESRWTGFF
jgi:hypothetical protein